MIVATNIEFGKWGTVLDNAHLAAVAIDRIMYYGYFAEFGGQSRRFEETFMMAGWKTRNSLRVSLPKDVKPENKLRKPKNEGFETGPRRAIGLSKDDIPTVFLKLLGFLVRLVSSQAMAWVAWRFSGPGELSRRLLRPRNVSATESEMHLLEHFFGLG